MRFHPLAWLTWWGAAALAVLLARNPLYLSLALLATLWVRVALGEAGRLSGLWPWIVRWGWAFLLLAGLFNGLTIHYGSTVLFRLPSSWPLVGGNVTLEAVTFGLVTGLNLLVLLLLFDTFGAGADYAALLRFVPGFLFRAGLVTSIALTFVPQTVRTFRDVREAQVIRGHRFRSWRDLVPLLVPVVVIGLERSVQLAEAMESRGFGGATGAAYRLWPRIALLLGIAALLLGLGLRSLWGRPWPVALLIAAGLVCLGWGLKEMGRRVRRTRYRLYPWAWRDSLLAVAGGALAAGVLATRLLAPGQLLYYPYPRVTWPAFSPWLGALFALIALPALLGPYGAEEESQWPP